MAFVFYTNFPHNHYVSLVMSWCMSVEFIGKLEIISNNASLSTLIGIILASKNATREIIIRSMNIEPSVQYLIRHISSNSKQD